MPPYVAVIEDVPEAIPVTLPFVALVLLTDALLLSLLVHVTIFVMSWVVLSE